MTPRQLAALDFVRDRISELGFAPTIRELGDHLGINASSAHKLVDTLIHAGQLERDRTASRGLRLPAQIDLRHVGTGAMRDELARRGVTLEALKGSEPIAVGRRQTCAADTCGREVTRGQLMCRGHWFALPHSLRESILRTHSRALRSRSQADAAEFQALVTEARDLIDGGRA